MKYIEAQNLRPLPQLGPEPHIAPDVIISKSCFGKYTEVQSHTKLNDVSLGDYSYITEHCNLAHCRIGKFVNIASMTRINPGNHPMEWVSLHHCQYRRRMYGFGETDDQPFFNWRARQQVNIGHDVWIGHNVTVLAGVTIGNGAVVGSGAVVSKNIPPYGIAVGVPAKVKRFRFEPALIEQLEKIAWWDWDHETLKKRLPKLRDIRSFLDQYGDPIDTLQP